MTKFSYLHRFQWCYLLTRNDCQGSFYAANWLILVNFDPNFIIPEISVNQVRKDLACILGGSVRIFVTACPARFTLLMSVLAEFSLGQNDPWLWANFLRVVQYVCFPPLRDTQSAGAWVFPQFNLFPPVPTYTVLKWDVYIWLIVLHVHIFNIPWQDYTFLGWIQGVLSSNITPKFGQLQHWS